MMFFPITTQASNSVIIVSALVIIVGVLMIAVIVWFVLFVHYESASRADIFDRGTCDRLKLAVV